tara:strand:+ start:265 stop:714 length:450 start_codon:yes stop_codon:yes gene_type:complete
MNDDTFLYIAGSLVAIGVTILLLIEFVFKKWKCKDGKCKRVFGGDYSTLKDCNNKCDLTEHAPINAYGYDCVNNNCVKAEGGLHATTAECNANCGASPDYTNYSDYGYGYPYGLNYGYPYGLNYGYGRRWSPRRRSPGRGRRGGSPIRG